MEYRGQVALKAELMNGELFSMPYTSLGVIDFHVVAENTLGKKSGAGYLYLSLAPLSVLFCPALCLGRLTWVSITWVPIFSGF